jgi:hypothetical protein
MDDPYEKQRDQFYIARAEALNSYNLLEQGLAIIFAQLLSEHKNFGTLIISKMVNTRARNEVVQKVIDYKTGKRFRPFTNSFFVLVGETDLKRHQVVHWHLGDDGDGVFYLRPTDLLSESQERLTEDDLDELTGKCIFLASAINQFSHHIPDWSRSPAWHERFLQPLKYPPEPDDPLYRFRIGGEGPFEASLA